jgi:hypothetical protein
MEIMSALSRPWPHFTPTVSVVMSGVLQVSSHTTTGISGLGGCGLAIAYKNDVRAVKPEDFAIFSVNHRCVWNRFTEFEGMLAYMRS